MHRHADSFDGLVVKRSLKVSEQFLRLFLSHSLLYIQNLNLNLPVAEGYGDDVTLPDGGGSLRRLVVDQYTPAVTGLIGNRTPLDQAGYLQIFVQSHLSLLKHSNISYAARKISRTYEEFRMRNSRAERGRTCDIYQLARVRILAERFCSIGNEVSYTTKNGEPHRFSA